MTAIPQGQVSIYDTYRKKCMHTGRDVMRLRRLLSDETKTMPTNGLRYGVREIL